MVAPRRLVENHDYTGLESIARVCGITFFYSNNFVKHSNCFCRFYTCTTLSVFNLGAVIMVIMYEKQLLTHTGQRP